MLITRTDIVLEDVGGSEYPWLHGSITKPVVLFGQQRFDEGSDKQLGLQVSKGLDLTELVDKLNDYLIFLANARDILETHYKNEFQSLLNDYYEGLLPSDWYESLQLYGATIFVDSKHGLGLGVTLGDCVVADHLLEVEFADQEIVQMFLDG